MSDAESRERAGSINTGEAADNSAGVDDEGTLADSQEKGARGTF